MWKMLLSVVAIGLPLSVFAEIQHYLASLEQSQWQVNQRPRIECRLEHNIPDYGKAVFVSQAGKNLNMNFTLDMWVKPDAATDALLISKAPAWKPGVTAKTITELTYHQYFNGEVPKQAAWTMLRELERGMEPTFYYGDWHDPKRQIAVGLSVANYSRKFAEFKQCLSALLPYSFEDIAFTVLNYQSSSTELTEFSRQQLARVQEYLTYDSAVDLILVDGYADSYGSRSANKRISVQRANNVKAFFVAKGIPADRIVTQGYGEGRPVSSNLKPKGRMLNRRVVVRFSK